MLDEKNENRFLNTLNDIDDDLLEEIAETTVEPEIITTTPEKSWSIRFAGPAAASLAVIAAVGIGALIIGRNISFSLGGDTTVTEIEPASSGGEQSNFQIGSGTVSTDTTPSQSTIEGFDPPNGVLSRPISEVNIPNISGYSVDFDVSHDEIIGSVIIDTKKSGDYVVSLYGHGVFTDFENSSKNIIFAHRLTVVVSKGDGLVDLHDVYDPLDPNAPVFMLMKDHLDCYTEIAEFGQNEYMIIFRSLKSNVPVPEAMFFFVNDKGMFECKRNDLNSDSERKDRSETLSAAVSVGSKQQDKYVIDDLTGDMYSFILFTDDCVYYVKGKSNYPWGVDGYTPFDPDSMFVIDEFTYTGVEKIIDVLTSKTVISEITVGDYTLHLMGQKMRKDSNGVIHLYNPQTIISKNGDYIGSINMQWPILTPDGSSVMYEGNYTDYIPRACIMNNSLLIIDNGLDNSYFEEGSFYVVKNDNLYDLHGYWPGVTNSDPPAWTEGKQGYDLIVDTENQTVIFGFMKFEFNFEELPAMYNYTVSWLEGPIE